MEDISKYLTVKQVAKKLGRHRRLDTRPNPNKIIATIGLDDVVVVDTEDALLICAKNRSQDVKKVVEQLKEEGKYL